MAATGNRGRKLGISGFGRIGKLFVWHHAGRKAFDELVINIGRQAGTSLADIARAAGTLSEDGAAELKGVLGDG